MSPFFVKESKAAPWSGEWSGEWSSESAATYMDRHGVPSAGDWALDRFGAVFLQGTESAVVDTCT
jgi:hypothetical protein